MLFRSVSEPRLLHPAPGKAEIRPARLIFDHAYSFRKRWIRTKLRLGDFKFSLAPATGKNPGAIYIKRHDDTYLGKVMGGKLFTVALVDSVLEREIAGVINDPASSAIAYGKRWGKCSVCARDLTDEASIAKGIGPVCATRFGFKDRKSTRLNSSHT